MVDNLAISLNIVAILVLVDLHISISRLDGDIPLHFTAMPLSFDTRETMNSGRLAVGNASQHSDISDWLHVACHIKNNNTVLIVVFFQFFCY